MEIVRKIELSEEEQIAVSEFFKLKDKFKSLCCDNGEKPCDCDFCPFYFFCHHYSDLTEQNFVRCLENIM